MPANVIAIEQASVAFTVLGEFPGITGEPFWANLPIAVCVGASNAGAMPLAMALR